VGCQDRGGSVVAGSDLRGVACGGLGQGVGVASGLLVPLVGSGGPVGGQRRGERGVLRGGGERADDEVLGGVDG
jgi:hypothetical protein